ncbi:MAG: CRISPR-associated protein Cas4 [Chloroflexota bacterium]
MFYLSIVIFFIAILLIILSRRQEKSINLPPGKLVALDQKGWKSLQKPLFSPYWGLTGKPDYLYQINAHLIPIEVKTSRTPHEPYLAHILQLAAYCLLVEDTYHKTPPYGYLHYRTPPHSASTYSKTWQIPFTRPLKNQLLQLLEEMRRQCSLPEIPRSHSSPARCDHCGYRHICDQKIE